MLWKITAITAISVCLILAYRNRKLWRIVRYGNRKQGWEGRVESFMREGDQR